MKKWISLLMALVLMAAAAIPVGADTVCTSHRWVSATAEEPAYCIRCGALDYTQINCVFPDVPFNIEVLDTMNCRRNATVGSEVISIVGKGIYTITQMSNGWGKMQNGGWISLYNPDYVRIIWGTTNDWSTGGWQGSDESWKTSLKNARVGDTVTFGRYEQDGRSSNGQEPIEWTVLERSGSRVLLLSRYCLINRRYNTSFTSVSWENCSLRSWLNDDFLYDAFTYDERSAIACTKVVNSEYNYYEKAGSTTYGGADTYDYVFVLSCSEAKKYFKSDASRMGYATAYARNNGIYVEGNNASWWWLRGPGEFAYYACLIGTNGNVNNGGNYVDRETGGVRPALWVDTSSFGNGSTVGTTSQVYINELAYSSKNGKLWTRGENAPGGWYHTNSDAPGCWSDRSTPGFTQGTVKDAAGRKYTYGLHVDGDKTETYYVSYALNGKYNWFSGTCGYPAKLINPTATPNYTKYVYIYGDGRLLYTTTLMGVGHSSQDFRIDVSGVQVLRIEYPATLGPNEAATIFDGRLS